MRRLEPTKDTLPDPVLAILLQDAKRGGAMIDFGHKAASILFLAVLAPTVAHAQGTASARETGYAGLSLQFMSPTGEFRQNIGATNWDHRGGFAFNLIGPLTHSGFLSIRLDCMFGSYDKDCPGCHRLFRSVSVGPEVSVPRGWVRPYVMGEWGYLDFESFKEANGDEADTGAGQWIYGGGVRIQPTPANRWLLDVGARSHNAGTMSYLRGAGVQTDSDGILTGDSGRSRTTFVTFAVGLQYHFK